MYVQYSLSLLLALFGVMVIFSQLNVVECAIYVHIHVQYSLYLEKIS